MPERVVSLPVTTNRGRVVEMQTAHHPRLDPARYFPIEIVNLIFSFVVYHVEDLELANPWQNPWQCPWERMMTTIPSSEIIAGCRDAPIILASVSRVWYQIATSHPPLWSTILIDQSEGDCLEQVHLFHDHSGKELLDIVLLYHATPTLRLKELLMEHTGRFRVLVGLSAQPVGNVFSTLLEWKPSKAFPAS